MTYRVLYELLLIIAALVVAWHLLVKPIVRIVARPKRRGMNALDDLVGPTNAGEAVADATRRLGDERALAKADELNQRAADLRAKRRQSDNN